LEETALNEIDQLIGSLDEPINNPISILKEELNEPNPLVKIKKDLTQPLEPQKASQISPFKGTTWKENLTIFWKNFLLMLSQEKINSKLLKLTIIWELLSKKMKLTRSRLENEYRKPM
ncbi:4170_t:CDS:1, partial [Cetraspora pellucida]